VDAQTLIETYVNDVAARLPSKIRNDVGLELRSLLTEKLTDAGSTAGRTPDQEMAMKVVNEFGQPDEVARRYRGDNLGLIEPAQVPHFLKLVALTVGLQWAFTLPRVATGSFSEWWTSWGLGAFWWIGVLFTVFATASWLRRHSPAAAAIAARQPAPSWRPSTREATRDLALHPVEGAVHWSLSAVVTAFFAAPVWIVGHLLPRAAGGEWVAYDDFFSRYLLLPLLAIMVARLLLFALVLVRQRSSSPVAIIRSGLWVCFVALLWWAELRWQIFANVGVNFGFKSWLVIFLIGNTVLIVMSAPRWLARV
jgi:hypothetical protein